MSDSICEYPAQDPQGRFVRHGSVVVKCGKPATHRCTCCDEASCTAHAGGYFNARPLLEGGSVTTSTDSVVTTEGVERRGESVRSRGGHGFALRSRAAHTRATAKTRAEKG